LGRLKNITRPLKSHIFTDDIVEKLAGRLTMNVLEMALKIESPGEGLPTWFSSVAIMSVTDK
jgi:hypothetical protein